MWSNVCNLGYVSVMAVSALKKLAPNVYFKPYRGKVYLWILDGLLVFNPIEMLMYRPRPIE